MTDTHLQGELQDLRSQVRRIVAEELYLATPEMLEAGSRAWSDASIFRDPKNRNQLRQDADDSAILAAIWRHMLAVKIGMLP